MAEKYYSYSPYNYVLNNPINLIDPDGRFVSPYFDKNGQFLGIDENGYEGDIYILDKKTFSSNSKDGIAYSKGIQNSENTFSLKSAKASNISLEAQSKIFTHALKQMKDIDFSKLYNGEISIYSKQSPNGKHGGYNNPDRYNRFGFSKTEDGSYKITAVKGSQRGDLSTVEGIQNMLGVHEYYGHGIKGYTGGKNLKGNHWKAYDDQIKHSTFDNLSKGLQKNILEERKGHMRYENPLLYQKTYK